MAFGGLQYCRKIGLKVPLDIGIAGWGNMQIAAVLQQRLTSMHVPHLKLGKTAAEMIIARIEGEPVETSRDIGFRLIPGSTVRNSEI